MNNVFGDLFSVMTFGESHGPSLGAVIDGCPSGVNFDISLLEKDLRQRRPGQSEVVSGRNEPDSPQVLSGVFEGKTLGTPIAIIVNNKDQRSEDYNEIKKSPRPGHADDVWLSKYLHTDYRGGGRSSGRETVSRVMAGSVAKMMVKQLYPDISVLSFCSQVGELKLSQKEVESIVDKATPSDIYNSLVRIPIKDKSKQVEELLLKAKAQGQSYGGLAQVIIKNPPSNLGEPVFNKIKAVLAQAYLSIGATNGVDLGQGFDAVKAEGTEFHSGEASNYGGIRGGITTGETLQMRVSFKPTSSVLDVAKKGRHDPCIVPRAISVLEAMTWLVLADFTLKDRLSRCTGT